MWYIKSIAIFVEFIIKEENMSLKLIAWIIGGNLVGTIIIGVSRKFKEDLILKAIMLCALMCKICAELFYTFMVILACLDESKDYIIIAIIFVVICLYDFKLFCDMVE